MSFECEICGDEITSAKIGPIGAYCPGFMKGCWYKAEERWKAILDEARNLDLDELPAECSMRDFEMVSLSVAIKVIETINEARKDEDHENHEAAMNVNPFVMYPSEMAKDVKERVIPFLRKHIETEEARGHERWFSGGTFWFRGDSIPVDDMLKAFESAGYMSRTEEEVADV